MKQNDFIFADLSTYEVETAKKFYSNVFGWEYKTQDGEYFVAYDGDKEVSGLYETPQKFQDMNMPSFWMTYIQVDSVDETVEKAKKLGAIIEMTENQQGFGKVALIRDPLGSGFTIYEGENLDSRNFNTSNTLVWNELFISDISKVKDFYTGIFDWNIQENNRGNWSILNGDDKEIGAITELDEAERSKYQYWGSVFLVENREETKKKVLENGGAVVFETDDLSCFTDFSGTAFFYLVEKWTSQAQISQKSSKTLVKNIKTKSIPYKALLVLGVIFVCLAFSWYGIFGILFLIFAYQDIKNGSTYLFENVQKNKNPLTFWAIEATWILLSIISIFYNA